MTKAKKKSLDCVEVKRRAQQELLEQLEGHSPQEQYEIIRRLADELPLWKALRSARPKAASRSTAAPAKRRKTG